MKADKIKYPCCFSEEVFMDKKYELYEKFYDKHLFRYSLKCSLGKKGKTIVVILMNPSFADEYHLDSTLCNVEKFLKEKTDYSEFCVLNIFPIRTPNSKDIKKKMEKYKKYQEENNKYIINILKNSSDILVAWGSKYHSQAKWIFKFLKNKHVYAYNINKDDSPRHFAPQAYNRSAKKLQKYDFNK